jgi:hypothetical protein
MKQGVVLWSWLALFGAASALPAQYNWRRADGSPVTVANKATTQEPIDLLAPRPLPADVLEATHPADLGRPRALALPPLSAARQSFLDADLPSGVVAAAFQPPPIAMTTFTPVGATAGFDRLYEEDGTDFAAERGTGGRAARPALLPVAAMAEAGPALSPMPSPAATLAQPTVSPNPALKMIGMTPGPTFEAGPVLDSGVPDVDPLHHKFYGSAEYLLWCMSNDRVPALVTTSAVPDAGILGRPTTQILFGDGPLDRNPRSGARFTGGIWLDMWCDEAIEATGFFLPMKGDNFAASGVDYPVLARPFFSLNRRAEASELVSSPGVALGNIRVDTPSQFWGVEINGRWKCCCSCDFRLDFLAGLRYLNLEESILIQERVRGLAGAPPIFVDQQITVSDYFAGRNSFVGAQVGVDAEWRWGRWFLDARGKLALGGTYHEVKVDGSQVFVGPDGRTQRFTGGLLALPSNIGTYQRGSFTVVPEITLNVGYQVTDHFRAFVGYNFLYWSSVVRPGQQIDRVLDETLIPNFNIINPVPPAGQNRPAMPFEKSDFWAQGLNVGFELRY